MKQLNRNENASSEETLLAEQTSKTVLGKIGRWIFRFQHIIWIFCITILLIIFTLYVPKSFLHKVLNVIKAQGPVMGLVLFFCFIALSLVWSAGQRIDESVFRLINKHERHAPRLDWVMLLFTQTGNFFFSISVAVILFLFGKHQLAYELLFGVLTMGLVIQFTKTVVRRPRPYDKIEDIRVVGKRDGGRSFPSGHTSHCFFMVSLLLHYYQIHNILAWIGLFGAALFIGVTRIYKGVHYPRDVIAGAILGSAWGIIGVILNSYIFSYLGIHLIRAV